jgi:NhaP-type Na+/H+ or K+/H+ antiporter
MLAVESGCNDGAAFPFLYIALYLTLDASDAHAVEDWVRLLLSWPGSLRGLHRLIVLPYRTV